jgi:hypothetical protein
LPEQKNDGFVKNKQPSFPFRVHIVDEWTRDSCRIMIEGNFGSLSLGWERGRVRVKASPPPLSPLPQEEGKHLRNVKCKK